MSCVLCHVYCVYYSVLFLVACACVVSCELCPCVISVGWVVSSDLCLVACVLCYEISVSCVVSCVLCLLSCVLARGMCPVSCVLGLVPCALV